MAFARRPARSAALLIACSIAVGACGSDEQPSAATLPTETIADPATTVGATPVEVVDVYESVQFYPACGNEVLRHGDATWYTLVHVGNSPVDEDLQSRVDDVLAVEREDASDVGPQGFARVAPPGPGDDIGTLAVWADGVARWTSESGDLDVWMVDDEITYNWVC